MKLQKKQKQQKENKKRKLSRTIHEENVLKNPDKDSLTVLRKQLEIKNAKCTTDKKIEKHQKPMFIQL